MRSLLKQVKERRVSLGLKQHDMMLRVGISRQQYQRLESKGNPTLETLELVALGLKSELVLVPQDKLEAVLALLSDREPESDARNYADDPWKGLLGDDE